MDGNDLRKICSEGVSMSTPAAYLQPLEDPSPRHTFQALSGTPMKGPLYCIYDEVHYFRELNELPWKKKNSFKKLTKYGMPTVCFLTSSFLLLIRMEAFISEDLEPTPRHGKETKPHHVRQMHVHTKDEQEHTFYSYFGRLDHTYKRFSPFVPISKHPTTLHSKKWEDSTKNLLTSPPGTLPTRYWNYISTGIFTTALFLCVAMEFQKQENHWSVVVIKLFSHSIENKA